MMLVFPFLSRVSMPMHAERDTVMANLSVGLSVTQWYCIETNLLSSISFHLLVRIWLVFWAYRRYKISKGTPSAGAINT